MNDKLNKTALITGISGQDGAYLAKFLIGKGYRVIGTVRSLKVGCINGLDYLGLTPRIIIEEVDLQDITNIIRILKKFEPDEVYNLAAQSSVGLSFVQPLGTFSFNTSSVNNLLEAIRLLFPKTKLYQASSSEMFGHVERLPITIKTPMHPVSPYAVSKMAAHFMAQNYREAYNLFVCCGILFNHESFLRNSQFFVKKIIQEAIKAKEGIVSFIPVGNLNLRRDFGFAPMYVEAMWKMMQQERPDDYIVCSGKTTSLKDVAHYILEKVGVKKSVLIEDRNLFRPNEIYEIFGDSSRAKEILSWHYNLSFFEVLDLLIEEELRNWCS